MDNYRKLAAVLLLAIVVAVLGTPEATVRAISVAEPIVATAAEPCALVCWMGSGGSCPTDYHIALTTEVESARNVEWGTGPHNDYMCYPQDCETKHGFDCVIPEGLEALRASLVDGDANRASMLIRQNNERVVLNRARSALQALSCTGEVIAHMPISPVFAARVEVMLQ